MERYIQGTISMESCREGRQSKSRAGREGLLLSDDLSFTCGLKEKKKSRVGPLFVSFYSVKYNRAEEKLLLFLS